MIVEILWFVDGFTNVTMHMTRSSWKTKKQGLYSSQKAERCEGLVRDFTDFIFEDDNANVRNGYGGDL